MQKLTVIFFPGTWGHDQEQARGFWFHVVARFLETRLAEALLKRFGIRCEIQLLFLAGQGKTRREYLCRALGQVQDVPNGTAIAVAYSAGTEDARWVADARPDLFRHAVFIGGLEVGGLRFGRFLAALRYGWFPFLRGFLTGYVDVRDSSCIARFFAGKEPRPDWIEAIRRVVRPEPMRVVLSITPLAFLVGGSARPFPAPISAIVGSTDFFAQGARYPDEDAEVITVSDAGHDLPLDAVRLVDATVSFWVLFLPQNSPNSRELLSLLEGYFKRTFSIQVAEFFRTVGKYFCPSADQIRIKPFLCAREGFKSFHSP